jgi:hypothetical protein
MRRRLVPCFIISAATALVLAPRPARAEGYVSPFIGVNFANNSVDRNSAKGKLNFGFDAGYMGAGVFGAEFDFGYAPDFFGESGDFGDNHVLTAMGNLILGVPIGGTHGAGVRPYASVGVGVVRTQVTGIPGSLEVPKIDSNHWGLNAGVGMMGFFSDHAGLRGDIRYFRDLQGDIINTVDWGSFHFWRATIGVVIR